MMSGLPSSAIYFATYDRVKRAGEVMLGGQNQAAVHCFAGAASELACAPVYVPFEVVKVRLQLGA